MHPEDDWIEKLRRSRKGKGIGREILFSPSIDSTNQGARDQALKGAGEGLVVLADRQSAGKGRRGRTWESPSGVNVYLSVILRPALPPPRAPQIPLFAGVAVARALNGISELPARLKWPNDVLIHGRKVAGILAELEIQGGEIQFIILGVGVNVNWGKEEIPSPLGETATSLMAEGEREIPRELVAAAILEELEKEYLCFLEEGFSPRLREEWNRLSWVNSKWATIEMPERRLEGKVLGLDTDGALLLLDKEEKTHRLIAGEISLRLRG
jgi:BirA family transcriptional regulator, biotin operon repressor / biotin---[acetyl-CoA-carboxylase] ligase